MIKMINNDTNILAINKVRSRKLKELNKCFKCAFYSGENCDSLNNNCKKGKRLHKVLSASKVLFEGLFFVGIIVTIFVTMRILHIALMG